MLSEVLQAVRLEGALFYNAEFSAPWCFRSPKSLALAPYFGLGSRHVILFHLLTEGHASVRLEGGPEVQLRAGDIVVFPHGDPHLMGNGGPVTPVDNAQHLGQIVEHGLKVTRAGGGGEVTRFICGYLVCDPELSRIFLSGLPHVLRVSLGTDPSGEWLANTIRHSVATLGDGPGGHAVLAKLAEALFAETLRQYMAKLGPQETGWLAAARDPEVGKALALMHARPADDWSLVDLARECGVSRSVLVERFQKLVGEAPMTYLARWRLQVGAQRLQAGRATIGQIAAEAGYRSEAAFNRAFKRQFGAPPARYRSERKAAANGQSHA